MKSAFIQSLFFCILLTISKSSIPKISLSQIESKPFGKTMVNLVNMNLKMNHPIDKIQDLLLKIRQELLQAKSDDDAQYKDDKKICVTSIKELRDTKKTYETELNSYKDNLENKKKHLEKKQGTHSMIEQRITELKNNLKSATDINTAKINEFSVNNKDFEEAINACNKALELLGTLVDSDEDEEASETQVEKKDNSSSDDDDDDIFYPVKIKEKVKDVTNEETGPDIPVFFQLSDKVENLKTILLTKIPKFASKFSPIIEALSEIKAKKVDQKALEDLLNLIQRLKGELEKEHLNIVELEKTRGEAFITLEKNLNRRINKKTNTFNELTIQISDLTKDIGAIEKLVVKTSAILEESKIELNTEQTRCKTLEDIYKADKAKRADELEILKELRIHFNNNIKNVSKDLKSRTENKEEQKP